MVNTDELTIFVNSAPDIIAEMVAGRASALMIARACRFGLSSMKFSSFARSLNKVRIDEMNARNTQSASWLDNNAKNSAEMEARSDALTTPTTIKNDKRYSNSRRVAAVNASNFDDLQRYSCFFLTHTSLKIVEVRGVSRRYAAAIGVSFIIFEVGGVSRRYAAAIGVSFIIFEIGGVSRRYAAAIGVSFIIFEIGGVSRRYAALNDKDEQTEVAEEGGADGFAANFGEGADGKAEPIPPADLLVEGEQSQLGEQPHRHRRRKLLLGRGAAANEHQLERVEVPAGHGHAEGVRPGGHAGAGHHGDARLQGDESEQDGRLKVLQRTGVQAVLVEGQQLLADNEQVDADVGEKGGHHDAAHHLAVARLGNGHQALALSVVLVQLVVQRRHLGGAADGNEENAGGVGV
ncbi:hypothetical protein TYRP_006245 [Tyrophagus putrescentiae]|nr:hypothetical protein TYRP_006245 [Tyrophagus putrescentiae]